MSRSHPWRGLIFSDSEWQSGHTRRPCAVRRALSRITANLFSVAFALRIDRQNRAGTLAGSSEELSRTMARPPLQTCKRGASASSRSNTSKPSPAAIASHDVRYRSTAMNVGQRRAVTGSPGQSGAEYQLVFTRTPRLLSTKWIEGLVDTEDFLGQWQQVRLLDPAGFGNRHVSAGDRTVPACQAGGQQLPVQALQIFCLGDRYQPVSPVPAEFTFHAALFVAACRCAVLTFKTPV